jgi:hypothetical protein
MLCSHRRYDCEVCGAATRRHRKTYEVQPHVRPNRSVQCRESGQVRGAPAPAPEPPVEWIGAPESPSERRVWTVSGGLPTLGKRR